MSDPSAEVSPQTRTMVERPPSSRAKAVQTHMAVMRTTGHIVWSTRADGKVEDVPVWRAYTGQTPDEVRGNGWLHAVHPADVAAAEQGWAAAVAARRLFRGELRLRRADGTYRTFAIHGLPVFDSRGRLRSWEGFCEDITDMKALQKERELLLQEEQAFRHAAESANAQLTALLTLTDTALIHLSLDDLLQHELDQVLAVMHVENTAILLMQPDRQTLRIRAARGLEEAVAAGVQIPLGQGFAGTIAASRQPLIVNDLAHFPVVNLFLQETLTSVAGVPLLVEDRVLGVLHIGSTKARTFTQTDVALLQRVADHLALAIDRAQMFEDERAARRDAQARTQELQVIFDSIADGIAVCNQEGALLRTNRAFDALLAIDHNPAYTTLPMAQRIQLIDGKDEHNISLQSVIAQVLQGTLEGAKEHIRQFQRLDGEVITASVHGAPLRDADGCIIGVVLTVRDITEQRRQEQEREAARVRESALRELSAGMDRFLETASHDLRAPITAMLGDLQVLQQRFARFRDALSPASADDLVAGQEASDPVTDPVADDPVADPQADDPVEETASEARLDAMSDDIGESVLAAQRLARLVTRLFDVAQARAGTLHLHMAPCDLVAIVRDQLAIVRSSAFQHQIQDNLGDCSAIPLIADADRLGQVVLNYLTNAMKYSDAEAPIKVRLSLEDVAVRLEVQDHGVGIPQAEQSRIWHPFYRVQDILVQNHVTDSLGLGLHICKTIIERHGGQVGVSSTVGQGSTFWFTLPLRAITPVDVHAAAPDDAHPA
jgi:PAS domain S-box-containing protein